MLVECDRHAGAFYVHLMQPKKTVSGARSIGKAQSKSARKPVD